MKDSGLRLMGWLVLVEYYGHSLSRHSYGFRQGVCECQCNGSAVYIGPTSKPLNGYPWHVSSSSSNRDAGHPNRHVRRYNELDVR